MRTIERTGQFKRDYKREAKGLYRPTLQTDLTSLLALLVNDDPLPTKYRDHALTGDWRDHRDCHLKPDLVLIYRKPDGKRDPATAVQLRPQHFLYFFPDPHGHGSFRPTLPEDAANGVAGGGLRTCIGS